MRNIEPVHPYSSDAVRGFADGAARASEGAELNGIARQVAAQYRRDTMSPVMVSGYLRLIEFVLLAACGGVIYAFYVAFDTHLTWQYPALIVGGSIVIPHFRRAVALLDELNLQQSPATT